MTFDAVRLEIASLRESGLTWRALARRYPAIPEARMAACLCAAYKHGREPHAADIRAALGLPVTVPVAVCEHCGKPPLSKHHVCAFAPKKPRPKRRNWRGLVLTLAGVLANQHG